MDESVVFTFPYQTYGKHATERHWQSAFDFREIVNKLLVKARSSIANCEIYFPIFSESIHKTLKIFSQHDLRKCR